MFAIDHHSACVPELYSVGAQANFLTETGGAKKSITAITRGERLDDTTSNTAAQAFESKAEDTELDRAECGCC